MRWLALLALAFGSAQAQSLEIAALDRNGAPLAALVDGNALRLRAELSRAVPRRTVVEFKLEDEDAPLARCTIAAGARSCVTGSLPTLGWYWSADGALRRERTLAAQAAAARAQLALRIAPRPVVLVHGFLASDKTWVEYTRPGGFLASIGLAGYAVGDGQAEGRMATGDIARPTQPTQTLPQNAAALARYIAGVKKATGAEVVDLVAHSMGGLIARYYVARLMGERDVAQLAMLGTPNAGSDCSALASSLGFFAPAALELRSAYLRQIFNPAVTRTHGVPFHLLAGDPIVDSFKAPCSPVPSDLVVSVDSAIAVPGSVQRLPVLHTDMTTSARVFEQFVSGLLRTSSRGLAGAPAPPPPAVAEATQFTRIFTGTVAAGATAELVVHIDRVAVASFALFDPSRSLAVTVRGASGNAIALDPAQHGLVRVDDPATLVHLGYGFANPRPGPWRITLHAAPDRGAEYALAVRVAGGARLHTRASTTTVRQRQPVTLAARLESAGASLTDQTIAAIVRAPDGAVERIALRPDGAEMRAQWTPAQAGLHGIDIVATAREGDLPIERTGLLAVDVQPLR